MKKCFAPLTAPNPKILILGTMPGEDSLAMEEYYGHGRNAFWPIMFKFFGAEFSADYNVKKRLITGGGLALWDTVASCKREGSLDSDIKDIAPNDINGFIKKHPSIRQVFFNGKSAEKFYFKYNTRLEGVEYIPLPSTSPAYAAKSFDFKLKAWSAALCKGLSKNYL
ncbi:TDG/mug DNA glycosylase family protein [Elusimicrobium simillimum]|uniref:DNA-deoxyinosine glycosylase n=1 Tax=Elusimicrobium simillimum TaxID=3143438 RepID=UPI003C6F0F8F